jgi:pimeloyl-ACP methyl ester carboxylesterase
MHTHQAAAHPAPTELAIPCGAVTLAGELTLPGNAEGLVIFAHGSGSSRHSPRNQFVASVIRKAGNGTLLFDLLTAEEEAEDNLTARLRFDIDLLAERLVEVTEWILSEPALCDLGLGYFGSSTGGGAALVAAAEMGSRIGAVVSRGGRPDLADHALPSVVAPTLLIVGGYDDVVIELNRRAFARMSCPKELRIVPRATHLFEEPGALETVAEAAADWFHRHLHLQTQAVR